VEPSGINFVDFDEHLNAIYNLMLKSKVLEAIAALIEIIMKKCFLEKYQFWGVGNN
jgi:hypothetical protein